jgi:hypothetical protein
MKVFRILTTLALTLTFCASYAFATVYVSNQGGGYKPCANNNAPAGAETVLTGDNAGDPGPLYPYPNSGGLWNYTGSGVVNLHNSSSSKETITINMHLGNANLCGSWTVGNTCYYTSPFTLTIPASSYVIAPWNFRLLEEASNDFWAVYITAVVPSGSGAVGCTDQSYTTTEHEDQ